MERRYEEFSITERNAQYLLLDETPPSNTPTPDLSLLLSIHPTFAEYVSWAVFTGSAANTYFVRKRIWDRPFDLERFLNPMAGLKHGWHTSPTISTQLVSIVQPELTHLLAAVSSILNVPIEGHRLAPDGARWFVKVPACFQDQFVSWYRRSDESSGLGAWIEEIHRILQNAWDSTVEHAQDL